MADDGQTVRECVFPAVEAPTAAEQQVLRRWGEAFQVQGGLVLRRFLGAGGLWQVGEPQWQAAGQALAGGEWAVWIAISGAVPAVLVLESTLAEALIAGALGLPAAATPALTGAADQAVLDVIGRELGHAVRQALGLTSPALAEVTTGDGRYCPAEGPAVVYAVAATLHGREYSARLLGAWADWRPAVAPGPSAPVGVVDRTVVEAALVEIEAVLPGTELRAGELLALRPGDIIRLGEGGQEVVLRVNGRAWGRGRAGARGDHLAVSLRQTALTEKETEHGD